MQRFDRPAEPANPYPDGLVEIAEVRYDTALKLLRLKDAPKMRDGEDADFIVAVPYGVSWRPDGGAWRQILVPGGLITDLVSVPRLARAVVGRVGPYLEAAIVHDYLYIAWQDVPGRGARDADRRFADDLFRALMREARVSRPLVELIFTTVRLFGAGPFRRRDAQRYADLSDPEVTAQLPFRTAPR